MKLLYVACPFTAARHGFENSLFGLYNIKQFVFFSPTNITEDVIINVGQKEPSPHVSTARDILSSAAFLFKMLSIRLINLACNRTD